jgi:hypothetical protein
MKVTIVTTEFKNLVNNPTGRVTYGVRVYDDAGHATYDNTMADALKDMPKGAALYTVLRDNPTNDAMEEMLAVADVTEVEVDGEAIDGGSEESVDEADPSDIPVMVCIEEGLHLTSKHRDGRCYFCGVSKTEEEVMNGM